MPFPGLDTQTRPTMRNMACQSLIIYTAVLAICVMLTTSVFAKETVIECSGMQRIFNRATNSKLPVTNYTRVFAIDDENNSILEYFNKKWAILDQNAKIDDEGVSARYSRDYPDGRIDVIFEFDRVNNSLVYILDIDERPGEFFNAHCQTGSIESY